MAQWQIIEGDCRDVLQSLPARSVHTCVTSPPYFGLRDYGTGEWEGGDEACDHVKGELRRGINLAQSEHSTRGGAKKAAEVGTVSYGAECGKCGALRVDRQIGLELTPDEFVAALVAVFREVRRVLRDDGTVWINLGDSYGPEKQLLGVPWRFAFAMQQDGWILRSDIIWAKPNPMPESVTDRPTKAHEYLFLLSKGRRYFYDAGAIREEHAASTEARALNGYAHGGTNAPDRNDAGHVSRLFEAHGRNKRSVWTVATQPYPGAHFATFPPKLIEPCILAGAPERACGECGAPWVRVTDGRTLYQEPFRERENKHDVLGGIHGKAGRGPKQNFGHAVAQTTGFQPSCVCQNEKSSRPLSSPTEIIQGRGGSTNTRHDSAANVKPGVVLDPFAGAGTTGVVALRHGRDFIGIELNAEYAELARWRIRDDAPLLNQAEVV